VTPERVCAAYALAHAAPNFLEGLTEIETFVIAHAHDLWARPPQTFPPGDWRSLGFLCGRGWGKSHAIATEINARVERGEIRAPALMAPTSARTEAVQVAFLVDTSPPWFRAERSRGSVEWPNGVRAEVFTPEAPGRPRSGNFDFAWLCEIVDWAPSTRLEAFENLRTATRVGAARFVWDTTSKGKNEIILALEAAHAADPRAHRIVRGTTFDNPLLGRKYLRDVCRTYTGRRYREELLGEVFAESAGALWSQDSIDEHRRGLAPAAPALVLVAVDPALSAAPSADETGIVIGARGADGHAYILADESGRYTPESWARIVVDRCVLDAAGVVIERNHLGDNASAPIRSEARTRGIRVEILPRDAKTFPTRRPGVIFIREVVAASSKGTRASGPATEAAAGRVHVVGQLDALELELTTFVPGAKKSPNRFDAHAYLVTELAGLEHDSPRAKSSTADAAALGAALTARLLTGAARGRIGL